MSTEEEGIEILRQGLDEAFQGEFMLPDIVKGKWAIIDTTEGIYSVNMADCGEPDAWNGSAVNFGICLANVASYYADYIPCTVDDVTEISQRTGYGARLSASGYMDCTDWCVFETEAEAIDYLIDTYAD